MLNAKTGSDPHGSLWLAPLSMASLGAMLVLPFLVWVHRQPVTTFYSEWLAVALGLLGCVILLQARIWRGVILPAALWLPLGLLLLLLVQLVLGYLPYWQHAALVGGYFIWTMMLMVLAANLREQIGLPALVQLLAWSLLIGSVLSAMTVAFQVSGLTALSFILPHQQGGYAGNLAQVNHLANYTALGLASMVFLWSSARVHLLTALILALVLLTVLALSGQRMAVLYVGLIAILGALLLRGQHRAGQSAYWLLALLPIFAVLQWLLPLWLSNSPVMPADRVMQGMQQESIRWAYIQQAWQMFAGQPWLGVGWGQFGWHNFLLTADYPSLTGYSHHAHNLLLQLLAETGLPGMLLLLGVACHWFWVQWRQPATPERAFLLLLLSILAIHSLLEYPLWYAYFLGLAAVLVGAGDCSQRRPAFRLRSLPFTAFWLSAAVMLLMVFHNYQRIDSWYQQGRAGEISDPVATLQQMTMERNQSLFAPYLDLVIVRALPDEPAILDDKLAINSQLMRFLPGDIEVYNQVHLLAKTGHPDAAQAQLDLAMRHYPTGMDNFWRQSVQRLLRDGEQELFPLIQQLQDYEDSQKLD